MHIQLVATFLSRERLCGVVGKRKRSAARLFLGGSLVAEDLFKHGNIHKSQQVR